MLSPHEIATLLVISRTNDARGVHPADLDALIEQNLVRKQPVSNEGFRVCVTPGGASLVDALSGYGADRGGHA